jgi:hypothetical protein
MKINSTCYEAQAFSERRKTGKTADSRGFCSHADVGMHVNKFLLEIMIWGYFYR